jgi:hypothetical protein
MRGLTGDVDFSLLRIPRFGSNIRSHGVAATMHLGQRVFPRAKRTHTRFLYHISLLYPFGATGTRFLKVHLAKVGVGGWVGDVI